MEANRKRKGFMKGKLVMSIYKATKASSAGPYNSKVKPSPLAPGVGDCSIVNQDHGVTQAKQKVPHHVEFIVNQDQVAPQPKQTVSFLLPAADGAHHDSYGIVHDNLYGVVVDEGVDNMATTYISTVRERLIKLHRINSEHKKLQDMQY